MYNQSPLHANSVILNLLFHVYMYVQILNELAVHDVYTYVCVQVHHTFTRKQPQHIQRNLKRHYPGLYSHRKHCLNLQIIVAD